MDADAINSGAVGLLDHELALLKELVTPDSGTGDEAGNAIVVGVVERELAQLGAEVERVVAPGAGVQLVGRFRGAAPDAGKAILSAHLDTVFPRGEAAKHPFRVEGDFAYGLGVSDCKGGVVVALGAVKLLRDLSALPLRRELALVFTCDEEKGSPVGRELIRREAADANAVYGLEPARGGNGVITYRPGYVTARVVVRGRKAHAFNGYANGVSAPFALSHALVALEKMNDAQKGILYTPYGLSSGNDLGSVVDRAEVGILVPLFDKTYLSIIRKNLAEDLVKVVADYGATAEVVIDESAGAILERNAGTVALFESVREAGAAIGQDVPEERASAPSDMNIYSDLGVPSVDGLGPYTYGMHVLDEHVRVSSLPEKTALVAAALMKG